MRENADQSNSEYGHFILSVHFVCSKKCCVLLTITCLVQTTAGFHSNLNCFKPIYSRLPPIYSSLPPGVNPKTVAAAVKIPKFTGKPLAMEILENGHLKCPHTIMKKE